MLERFIRDIYNKIVDLIHGKGDTPLAVSKQLAAWERELKNGYTAQLLKEGKLDRRMITPIIIFQSGKVGSTSVHVSLIKKYEELGLNIPIFHAHMLENIDQRIEWVKNARVKPENTINKLEESKNLRQQIDNHPEWSWNVISLVRDPVALKVSAFFQLLDESVPDWQKQYDSGTLTVADLREKFLKKGRVNIGGLDNWFDNQVKSIWGIDVYSTPFSKEKGYHIYNQNPKVNYMIIRLEDLNKVAGEAFYEFLGIKDFSIVNANVGTEKAYKDLYDKFKSLPMSLAQVEDIYNSRYVRCFYTASEISRFQKRWVHD